ncbi:CoA binding domain-containing protein [Peziza echinospora]|nr:CoA binding domain-containing protein [Peziza echinospora]
MAPPNLRAQIATFFASPHFALAGASPDPRKYGHTLYLWYHKHSLPLAAINPRQPPPTILPNHPPAISSLSQLPHPPATYSLSIVTPPKATLQTLREARKLGVKRVWMQPGSWDGECVEEVKGEGRGEGEGGGEFEEGWCVLVHGEEGIAAAKALKEGKVKL